MARKSKSGKSNTAIQDESDHWFVILEELSLARGVAEFSRGVGQIAREFCGAEEASYYLFDRESTSLTLPGGVPADLDPDSLASKCARFAQIQLLDSGAKDAPAMAAPVRQLGALVGVLVLSKLPDLDEETRAKVTQFTKIVGVVQQLASGRDDLSQLLARTEEFVVKAVEGRSNGGHVARVAQLCSDLGKYLDLSAQVRQSLWSAAQFHDIGEVSLRNRGSDTARKFHPKAGAHFLHCCSQLSHLAYLVESHHERYDGSGFPEGKKGNELPLESWVLALAEDLDEFWQAHTDLPPTERLSIFFSQNARIHHPTVVDALSGLVDSGRLSEILS